MRGQWCGPSAFEPVRKGLQQLARARRWRFPRRGRQGLVAALGAGIEEIDAGGELVPGGGDGFLPVAGGAVVAARGWADGHGLLQWKTGNSSAFKRVGFDKFLN